MSKSYTVEAVLRAVDKGFTNTLKYAENQIANFGSVSTKASSAYASGFANAAKIAIAAAGASATALVGFATKSEGSYRAMQAQFSQVFDTMESDATSALKAISSETNISSNRLKDSFTKIAAFGKTAGMDTAQSLDLTSRATKVAADSAAFYDRSIEDVTESLQSFLKGNFENDAALGISATETTRNAAANKLYGKSFKELDEAQKQLTLLRMVEEGNELSGALGQASREADGFENVLGNLKQSGTDLASAIGSIFFDDAISGMKQITTWTNNAAEKIRAFGTELNQFDSLGEKVDFIAQKFPVLKQALSFIGGASVLAGIAGLHAKFGELGIGLDTLQGGFSKVKTGLSTFGGHLSKVFTPFGPAVATVKGGLETVAIKGMYLGDALSAKFAPLGAKLTAPFAALTAKLSGVTALFPRFSGALSGVLGTFGTAFSGMSSIMTTFAGIAMNALMPAAIFGVFLAGLGLLQGQFGDKINELVNVAVTKGPTIITNLVNGMVSQIPQLINQGTQLIQQFTQVIVANAPAVFQGAVALISSLVQGVGANAGQLINSAIQIVGVLVNGLLTSLPQLLSVGMQFLVQLAQGVAQNIPTLLTTAQSIVTGFISSVATNLPTILQSGLQIIVTLAQGIITNLPQIVQTAISIVQSLIQGLVGALPTIISTGIQMIVQFAGALIQGLPQIIVAGIQLIIGLGQAMLEAIPQALTGVWEGIKNGFTSAFDWITGKSKESNSQVTADTSMTAATVSAKTAEMATNASLNMQNFQLGVTTATGQTNMQATADVQSLATSIGANLATANISATGQAQAMASGVTGAVSGMNLDGVNQTLQLANGIGSNIATASANATSQAQAINSNVSSNLQTMQGAGSNAVAGLSSDISSQLSQAASTAQSQSTAITNAVRTGFDQAKTAASTAMQGLATNVQSGFSKIVSTSQNGLNNLKNTFNTTFNGIRSQTTSSMSALVSAISNGMSKSVSVSQSSGNQIVSIFRGLAGQMASAGSFAGAGFANGLAGQAGYIYGVANSIASNVAATIRRALSIHSPSRVMAKLGGYTGEGLAVGMEGMIPAVSKVADKLAVSAIPDIQPLNIGEKFSAMKHTIASQLSLNSEQSTRPKQPMEFHFRLGANNFRAFTEDITNTQNLELILDNY
ncbi:hypothetical protein HO908_07700 [Streptococcus suis]|nr:hypothetical protein [Streptococcus suis]